MSGAVPLPSTGRRRGARARGAYHEQTATQSVDVSIDADGQTRTTTHDLFVPQASLEALEATLPQTQGAALPVSALSGIGEEDAPVDEAPGEASQGPAVAKSQSNHPLLHWIPHRLGFVRSFLRLDGRPKAVVTNEIRGCAREGCPLQKTPLVKAYRCLSSNCLTCTWYCETCILERHKTRPLDHIEIWMNGEWQPSTLYKLGLELTLGHWDGRRCRLRRWPVNGFVVIHTNGIHEVNVAFCGCAKDKTLVRDQLIEARWYPATLERPQMAATFEVLDQFDANCGAGKQNAYDFYHALEHLTDGAGLQHLTDRSKDFFRMAHEYRHILALKRGGRAHDPGGIETTKYGDLALLCPACPHEGMNTDVLEKLRAISPEIADAAPLFNDLVQLSMDCNFRAKNRMTRSTPETSPYLGDGMAYMVPEDPYETYTRTCANDKELSSCSRFGANILANLKAGKGLRTTGVGAVFCSRHEFFWPNSVGTLVKGERYSTMDFIFAAAVRRVRASSIHLYYDIVCQYSRNLNVRMLNVPPKSFMAVGAQKILHSVNISFGIPKFHNPGHLVICQLWFNLAFLRATGQTDGEASERAWAGLNPAASSLREMGPGTMRDTIDFFCGVWNWRKFVLMGDFLRRKLDVALKEARDHCEIYNGLYKVIRAESSATADTWVGEAVAFDTRNALDAMGRQITEGPDAVKNPYESRGKKQTLERARLESAQVAAQAMKDSDVTVEATDIAEFAAKEATASAIRESALTNFVLRGLKIEVLQWRAKRRKETKTILQTTERIEQRTELERQIRLFRKDQQWMMPLVFAAVQELEGTDTSHATRDDVEDEEEMVAGETEAEATVVYLPSELDKELARSPPILEVTLKEVQLRLGGMEDWLDTLRQQLRVRGTVTQWKIDFSGGQRMATRTINRQRVITENIVTAREMYRLHRARFLTLLSYLTEQECETLVPPNWAETYQDLLDDECRPLNSSLLIAIDCAEIEHVKAILAERNGGVASGASSYRIPWIWYKVAEGTEVQLNDDMRVEFVKCRARAIRWVEEVYKLAYEMVRAPAFCSWKAAWWTQRVSVRMPEIDEGLQDGISAYARKQATIFRRHGAGMEDTFKKPLQAAAQFAREFGLDGVLKVSI